MPLLMVKNKIKLIYIYIERESNGTKTSDFVEF